LDCSLARLCLLIVFDGLLSWRTINIQTQFRESLGLAHIFGNPTSVGPPFLANSDFRFVYFGCGHR
jgi:hypothetical protein